MPFLALFVTLPARQSAGRMRVWRALKSLGAGTLRDGVYLLPESGAHAEALESVAQAVRGVGGTAEVHVLDGADEHRRAALVALFDRGADYAALVKSIRNADAGDARALRALRREFSALANIDFFPGEARRQAEKALLALEAKATGEPANVLRGPLRRLAAADYQGRLWATRRRLWVDRMASAWLISRHIDRAAKFVWLTDPGRCPKKAVGFDFDGAAFTHAGGLVTFEVLAASFGLDADPAIARIGAIVHFLDVGGIPVPEAAGIEAILAGARARARNDDELLAEAGPLFDSLHAGFSQGESR